MDHPAPRPPSHPVPIHCVAPKNHCVSSFAPRLRRAPRSPQPPPGPARTREGGAGRHHIVHEQHAGALQPRAMRRESPPHVAGTLLTRAGAPCGARRKACLSAGSRIDRPTARASRSAWLYPRRHRRLQCSGTGTTTSVVHPSRAFASLSPSGRASPGSPENLKHRTTRRNLPGRGRPPPPGARLRDDRPPPGLETGRRPRRPSTPGRPRRAGAWMAGRRPGTGRQAPPAPGRSRWTGARES